MFLKISGRETAQFPP